MPTPPPFESLDRQQQALVELLAVAHGQVTQTELSKVLKRQGVAARDGGRWSSSKVGQELPALQEQGWLVVDRGVWLQPAHRDDIVRALLRQERYRLLAAEVQFEMPSTTNYDTTRKKSPSRAVRDLRVDLLLGHQPPPGRPFRSVSQIAFVRRQYPEFFSEVGPFLQAGLDPMDSDLLARAHPDLQAGLAADLLEGSLAALTPTQDAFVRQHLVDHPHTVRVRVAYVRRLLLRGDWSSAERFLGDLDAPEARVARAWMELGRGEVKSAIKGFDQARKALRKATHDRSAELEGDEALLWPLALIAVGDASSLQAALRLLKSQQRRGFASREAVSTMSVIASELQDGAPRVLPTPGRGLRYPLGTLLAEAAAVRIPRPRAGVVRRALPDLARQCEQAGWAWLEREFWALHAQLERVERQALPRWGALESVSGQPLVDLMEVQEPWRARLEALTALSGPVKTKQAGAQRLVWTLEGRGRWFELTAKVQKRNKSGWTAGRVVGLSRMATKVASLTFATDQDREVMAAIRRLSGWYGHHTDYEFDMGKALRALLGHPLLFDGLGNPLSLVEEPLRLQVRETAEGTELSLTEPPPEGDFELREDGVGRLRLVAPTARQRKAASLLYSPLLVPKGEQARVEQALGSLAQVLEVHSDASSSGPALPGDARPVLQLRRQGEGLGVRIRVRPLGPSGPAMVPGEGAVDVLASPDGEPIRARRDLAQEVAGLQSLVGTVPLLGRLEARPRAEIFVDDLAECLDLVDSLRPLQAEGRVEWARGTPLQVVEPSGAVQLRVTASHDWFVAAGTVHLGDDEVLKLQEILTATDGAVGRYVQLADGRFLALTEGLVRGLGALREVGTDAKGGIRFHPMAAPVVSELLDETEGERPESLRELRARMASAGDVTHPVPRTLQAVLRDYQVDGFQWMARLADWGGGACLADDMGLGKTVQALALLLHRAADGPALVVAPTSVCAGWREEATRFAPTLAVHELPARGRAAAVNALGPGDLLLVSHGLLPRAEEALAGRRWSTVVIDEAQAIKNPDTKRAKAAFKLQAGFRLAATGTPVENRTGELWSLYRFLLPGLLGARKRFHERFGQADQGARGESIRQLRRLLRPFLLRRLKSDVLSSLPARTDVVRRVSPGPREASIYEALRRAALNELDDEQTGRMDVLAWLTKLRLAACDPRLVHGGAASGAKASELQGLVDELRSAGHRALIFSQFVRHLHLVRDWLESADIPFQYLDGSTPAKKRKQAVDAFQGGDGDVFLISLKAGGTGLNLTAADYVIHLDPWWNPAVEDQASDRAHRIGQTRPVTVVRLVTQGTVEEGILDLHQRKRELAEGLLADTAAAAPLDFDELVALLGPAR